MNIPFFQKRTNHSVSLEDARGVVRNAHKAWIMLLRLFFVGLIGVICISGFVFYKTNELSQAAGGAGVAEQKEAIDTLKLRQVIDTFKKKQEKFDALSTGASGLVDPSK